MSGRRKYLPVRTLLLWTDDPKTIDGLSQAEVLGDVDHPGVSLLLDEVVDLLEVVLLRSGTLAGALFKGWHPVLWHLGGDLSGELCFG